MKRRRNRTSDGDLDELRAEMEALEARDHELQLEHDILIKANELKKRRGRQSSDPEQPGKDAAG